MKKVLNVFFEKLHVGKLSKNNDDTLSFKYSENWLTHNKRFPLSPALPLQQEGFNNRQTKAYFDNLLPEGESIKTIEKFLKTSFEDPIRFLDKFGLDCAGALEITSMDEIPQQKKGHLEKLSFDEIDSILLKGQNLYVHTLAAHKGKFSIAGAQDKIPIIYKDSEIYIPIDSTPTTHILKPPIKFVSTFDSVLNEFLCMSLANLCGLEVPDAQIIGNKTPLFLINRYDRRIVGNQIKRIHQFDLCQAQGIPAAEKYEEDSGPSFAQNFKCIKNISDNQIHDLEICLNWLAFNLLIGNNDSHSKNLSFIYEDGETKIAPLYDLLSTSIYKDLSPQFAFRIGGQRLWYQMKRKNFQILAKDLGFEKNENIMIETMLNMSNRIESNLDEMMMLSKKQLLKASVLKSAQPEKLRDDIVKRIKNFRTKLDI